MPGRGLTLSKRRTPRAVKRTGTGARLGAPSWSRWTRARCLPVGTRGLPNGNYNLEFTVSGADPTIHVAPFTLR